MSSNLKSSLFKMNSNSVAYLFCYSLHRQLNSNFVKLIRYNFLSLRASSSAPCRTTSGTLALRTRSVK